MLKFRYLIPVLLVQLQACATVPAVIVQAVCPAIPPLEQQPALLEPTYSDKMASFLSGRLPGQTVYDYSLPSAKISTTPPVKP